MSNLSLNESYSTPLTIGWHTTISPSIIKGIYTIETIHQQCNSSFYKSAQIFLKNPMGAGSCKLSTADCEKVKLYLQQNNIFLVIHGQYIINFIKSNLDWAIKSVVEDIKIINQMSDRSSQTGVIIHMGKNTEKLSVEQCIINFYENIKKVIQQTKDCSSKLILETSTKTKNGNDIFYDIITFGKLVSYLKTNLNSEDYNRIGYCIDTAHIFASGYDIRTREGFDNFMMLWNEQIGNLTVFHLNDSKVGLCCCRDLHEEIGKGYIFKEQKEGLQALVEYAKSNHIPVILETAGDPIAEMQLIQSLIQ